MPLQQSWKRIDWRENVLWLAERWMEIITGAWQLARLSLPATLFSKKWCLYAWNTFLIIFAIINRANQHAGARCLSIHRPQPQHVVLAHRPR